GNKGFQPERDSILLIHGAAGSRLSWLDQLRGLDGEVNVLAPELPGHGDSEGDPLESARAYAEWLENLAVLMELPRCYVLGHSMGGAIAIEWALSRPNRFKGLILSGTGARLPVHPQLLADLSSRFREAVKTIVESCFAKDAPKELLEKSRSLLERRPPATMYRDFMVCNEFDAADRVEHIEIPTLIICGALDAMNPPEYSRLLHAKIPNSELTSLEHSGHMPMIEESQVYNRVLLEFARHTSSK
ncbi:MAG: alpha/beta hydrolase, partial [Deltaproteobacteria bacterium]|nr:alpha/beta hydrolase [Deltaproteobacteria bacterium]